MRDQLSKYLPAEDHRAILSRRKLFELAGLAVASAAIPPGMALVEPFPSPDLTGQGMSAVMDKLSLYMSEASGRELPDEVIEKTKQHILDTVAAMISGSELTPGRAALQFAGAYGGKEVATVVAAIRAGELQRRARSEEHTSELQSRLHLVCRLLLEKTKICHSVSSTQ